ncbi:MAG: hypothetical protein HYY30_08000 [Chloroflexi bacterium]|nr:hypothetical protein [Chloroflexota bacterium]
MPRIRFIKVACERRGAEYRVRLEKIADRAPFECLKCGANIETTHYAGILELICQHSAMMVKPEDLFTLEGDTAALLAKESARKLVFW